MKSFFFILILCSISLSCQKKVELSNKGAITSSQLIDENENSSLQSRIGFPNFDFNNSLDTVVDGIQYKYVYPERYNNETDYYSYQSLKNDTNSVIFIAHHYLDSTTYVNDMYSEDGLFIGQFRDDGSGTVTFTPSPSELGDWEDFVNCVKGNMQNVDELTILCTTCFAAEVIIHCAKIKLLNSSS